jgi:hypothetical protein
MNDTSTTNAPDAPPSKLRSSGRFSIQPTLPPVEESMVSTGLVSAAEGGATFVFGATSRAELYLFVVGVFKF